MMSNWKESFLDGFAKGILAVAAIMILWILGAIIITNPRFIFITIIATAFGVGVAWASARVFDK